jgi:hypothetical protein
VKATLKASITGTLSGANDVGDVSQTFAELFEVALTDGTGANQANNVFGDTRTINASSSENLDLAGGLTNALNATLTFTAIKAILIVADKGNTNNVVVGGAASNAFPLFGDATDTIAIKPGGCFMIADPTAAGLTVTAGTGDILKIANSGSGSAVSYTIIIVGEA